MLRYHKRSRRGDTLVEVMFAVAIFGMITVSAISIMNRGLYGAQETLEVTMARSEIDTQADALRFIHDAYVADMNNDSNPYAKIWKEIMSKAHAPLGASLTNGLKSPITASFFNYENNSCSTFYDNKGNGPILSDSFAINPRLLGNEDVEAANGNYDKIIATSNSLTQTPTFPRLLYSGTDDSLSDGNPLYVNSNFQSAQGIWVTAVAAGHGLICSGTDYRPDYYDFYIRTCWDSPDGKGISNTISSTVRLYNPSQILSSVSQSEGCTVKTL